MSIYLCQKMYKQSYLLQLGNLKLYLPDAKPSIKPLLTHILNTKGR